MEFVYKNSFGKLEYDSEKKIIFSTMIGLTDVPLAKDLFEQMMKFAEKDKVRAVAFDCLRMKGTFTKINPWLNEVVFPHVIPLGFICWSMATKDVFTRFAGNILINKMTPKEITAKLFDDMDKVEKWIDEQLEAKA